MMSILEDSHFDSALPRAKQPKAKDHDKYNFRSTTKADDNAMYHHVVLENKTSAEDKDYEEDQPEESPNQTKKRKKIIPASKGTDNGGLSILPKPKKIRKITPDEDFTHGCKYCFEAQLDCSRKDNPDQKRCIHCLNASLACESIPVYALPCEYCTKFSKTCSFRLGSNPQESCTTCEGCNISCGGPSAPPDEEPCDENLAKAKKSYGKKLAQPHDGKIPQSIRKLQAQSKLKSCSKCDREGNFCSWQAYPDEQNCRQCVETGAVCMESGGVSFHISEPSQFRDEESSSHESYAIRMEEKDKPCLPCVKDRAQCSLVSDPGFTCDRCREDTLVCGPAFELLLQDYFEAMEEKAQRAEESKYSFENVVQRHC
jgi:hypothetical protein